MDQRNSEDVSLDRGRGKRVRKPTPKAAARWQATESSVSDSTRATVPQGAHATIPISFEVQWTVDTVYALSALALVTPMSMCHDSFPTS